MSKIENKKTEISKIGKINTIEMLYEGTGYAPTKILEISSPEDDSISLSHHIVLEGIDFDLTYNPLMHLGYKSVLRSLGDLYAGLYFPEALSINIGVSGRFFYEDIEKIWQGITAASKQYNIKLLNLDLSSSLTGLTISVTSVGRQSSKVLKEVCKPKPNDLICLSGDIGSAYAGMLILEREKVAFNDAKGVSDKMKQPDLTPYKYLLESYLSPYIRPDVLNSFLAENITPSMGCFVTNGLASAMKEMSRDSGLGAKIYLEQIPISSKTIEIANEFNISPVTIAMNGGDDFKFLFSIPIEKYELFKKEFPNWDIIGHFSGLLKEAVLVTPDNQEFSIKAQGWNS